MGEGGIPLWRERERERGVFFVFMSWIPSSFLSIIIILRGREGRRIQRGGRRAYDVKFIRWTTSVEEKHTHRRLLDWSIEWSVVVDKLPDDFRTTEPIQSVSVSNKLTGYQTQSCGPREVKADETLALISSSFFFLFFVLSGATHSNCIDSSRWGAIRPIWIRSILNECQLWPSDLWLLISTKSIRSFRYQLQVGRREDLEIIQIFIRLFWIL